MLSLVLAAPAGCSRQHVHFTIQAISASAFAELREVRLPRVWDAPAGPEVFELEDGVEHLTVHVDCREKCRSDDSALAAALEDAVSADRSARSVAAGLRVALERQVHAATPVLFEVRAADEPAELSLGRQTVAPGGYAQCVRWHTNGSCLSERWVSTPAKFEAPARPAAQAVVVTMVRHEGRTFERVRRRTNARTPQALLDPGFLEPQNGSLFRRGDPAVDAAFDAAGSGRWAEAALGFERVAARVRQSPELWARIEEAGAWENASRAHLYGKRWEESERCHSTSEAVVAAFYRECTASGGCGDELQQAMQRLTAIPR
ncbi:MAG: hypothetical protein IT373_33215 [Polyangiaceae bacterium]|nr:hypothetical protein [Polyangiaceae bacterium]